MWWLEALVVVALAGGIGAMLVYARTKYFRKTTIQ